jgi:hypothetical protein
MNNDTIESFKEKILSILEIELDNLTSTFNWLTIIKEKPFRVFLY